MPHLWTLDSREGLVIVNVLLFGLGIWLLCLAAWFASQQATKVYYANKVFTDFSGDVAAWLRSEAE